MYLYLVGIQKGRNKIEVYDIKDLLNLELAKIKSYTEDEYLKLKLINELSNQNIKEKLDIYFKRRVAEVVITGFYQYIDVLTEKSKKKVKKVTWQSCDRTIALIQDFERAKKFKISFDSINIDFY